jgi:hypothetical protein
VKFIKQAPPIWSTPGQGLGKVAGAVYDPAGNPLRGTQVVLQESEEARFRGVLADSLGQFVMDSVSSGRRSVRLELLGYRTLIVEVTVVPGQIDTLCAMMQERRIPISGRAIGSVADRSGQRLAESRFRRAFTQPLTRYFTLRPRVRAALPRRR